MQKRSDQLVPLDAAKAVQGGMFLFGRSSGELSKLFSAMEEPHFRGRQIAEAIYKQRIDEITSINTLGRELRGRLVHDGWTVGRPSIAQVFQSVDGTERYLIQCAGPGAETVETVWMPEGDDGETGDEQEQDQPQALSVPFDVRHPISGPGKTATKSGTTRATICVSSQIGCAVNCQFCLTAKLGLQRNLTAGEIAGQVVEVMSRKHVEVGRDRLNLVFMGMGEPFLNYDSFMAAVRLLVHEVGLSPQRMTVSTSGVVPGIERFAQELSDIRPKLAISLNAPNDLVRGVVMPINRKWPIEAVVNAVRQICLRPRERITFEYVLLAGVTDRPEHAREVGRLVRRSGLPAKVNLIAWNPGPGIPYSMPAPESIEEFRASLIQEGVPTYLRKPRGRDIYAACGQLKRTIESAPKSA